MKSKKHVLLISYYWPPSGGAGVHRWLRFSKYFSENNCHLTVYCPDDAAWPVIDHALESEVPEDVTVIRNKIFEPHKFLGKGNAGVGFTQHKDPSALQKAIIWIRGNLFIPDSRVFWIKPSIRYLSKYLREHPEIETVISTGPPHSTHLIAKSLKKRFKLKWLADFRDPWTQIDFYHQLATGERADAKHKRLEKECLTEADEVITISESCADGLKEIVNRPIHVITNGYEFPDFDPSQIQLDKEFSITHFGSMPLTRNPLVLWKALNELIETGHQLKSHLKIRLVGTVDFQVLESIREHGLEEFVEFLESVPHARSIEMQRQTQLLLLVANNSGNIKGILTGKFFEYLGAKRPILAIGQKDSDLQHAVNETKSGLFIPFGETETMKKALDNWYHLYEQKVLKSEAENLDKYHSSYLAGRFVELLK